MKFRSDIGGTITGVRFWKATQNNGSHIGMLYSATGSLLAQATFSGETASGWQTVSFSTPVTIQANTTYIAAFFTTSGYSYDWYYFSKSADNPPLHALANGVDGTNGLYGYGAAPQFPTAATGANYWVDVVFSN